MMNLKIHTHMNWNDVFEACASEGMFIAVKESDLCEDLYDAAARWQFHSVIDTSEGTGEIVFTRLH